MGKTAGQRTNDAEGRWRIKTAEQWQNEMAGETSVEIIRRIQVDALTQALRLATQAKTKDQVVSKICDEVETIPGQTCRACGCKTDKDGCGCNPHDA